MSCSRLSDDWNCSRAKICEENSLCLDSEDDILGKLRTEQMQQILRASLAANYYASKDLWVDKDSIALSQEEYIPVALFNCNRSSRKGAGNKQNTALFYFQELFSLSTSFEVLLLSHSRSVKNMSVKKKVLKVIPVSSDGTLIGLCVNLVMEASGTLIENES